MRVGKDLAGILRQAEQQGCSYRLSGGNHVRIQTPDRVIFTSYTPSDHRAIRNLIAELRRTGLIINGRTATRRAA